jgi:hypothetical protein
VTEIITKNHPDLKIEVPTELQTPGYGRQSSLATNLFTPPAGRRWSLTSPQRRIEDEGLGDDFLSTPWKAPR